jgi:hypothetical protein
VDLNHLREPRVVVGPILYPESVMIRSALRTREGISRAFAGSAFAVADQRPAAELGTGGRRALPDVDVAHHHDERFAGTTSPSYRHRYRLTWPSTGGVRESIRPMTVQIALAGMSPN